MLPQTNLQLYRRLMERNYAEAAVVVVGKAYEIARRLFSGSYRPSHKPFVSHLCGTAGTLADWQEKPEVICAGLLHSLYLYGRYGDGEKGATPRRRQWLAAALGEATEQLVFDYTFAPREPDLAALRTIVKQDSRRRELVAIKLADLLDELEDGGPRYSEAKKLDFGITLQPETWAPVIELARATVGQVAAEQLGASLDFAARLTPPAGLRNGETSHHFLTPGVESLRRGPVGRSYAKFSRRILKWKTSA